MTHRTFKNDEDALKVLRGLATVVLGDELRLDHTEQEDVYQTVVLRLKVTAGRRTTLAGFLSRTRHPLAYLRSCLENAAGRVFEKKRREHRMKKILENRLRSASRENEHPSALEAAELVRSVLKQVENDEAAQLVLWRLLSGLSLEECAVQLGVSLRTAQRRQAEGIPALRQAFERSFGDGKSGGLAQDFKMALEVLRDLGMRHISEMESRYDD